MTGLLARLPGLALRGAILAYRWVLSPVLPSACRFHPSCSAYALEAVRRHGALIGGCLALRRILRCHPWGDQGYDPVPEHACLTHPRPRATRTTRSNPS